MCKPKGLLWALFASAAVMAAGCSDDANDGDDGNGSGDKNIVEVAGSDPQLSSLVAAVEKAELATTLSGPGPFTVFAPTNDAFSALLGKMNTSLDALSKEALTPILTYHVVSGEVMAAQVVGLKGAKTVNGADVRIRSEGSKVFLTAGNGNDVEVTMTDIKASNGVIHVINKVMLPPGDVATVAAANPNFSTLVAALTKANLVNALKAAGPFTVFAPTNDAFAKLLASNPAWKSLDDIPAATLDAVLKYHVVSGTKAYSETVTTLSKVSTLAGKDVTISAANGVKLNGDTNVTATDVLAANGVIHVIDKVLLPPSDTQPMPMQNIVQVASANQNFSSLVAAVTKADLAGTLSGPGPFTVFAPTNAAFSALLASLNTTLDALTKEALTPILTYHVVSGEVKAAQVTGLKVAKTVNGADFRIRTQDGKVFLTAGNGSDIQVMMTDIEASNGVIHVIDKVMLPPGDIPTVAAANPNFSTLVAALTKANLVNALKADGPFTVFAPTNQAFAALLASNPAWKSLDDIPAATLDAVLKYHVVAGTKAYSETVVTLSKVTTLQGKDVTINAGNGVKLNTSTNVTATDVLAKNGVIHVIDKVLLPPN